MTIKEIVEALLYIVAWQQLKLSITHYRQYHVHPKLPWLKPKYSWYLHMQTCTSISLFHTSQLRDIHMLLREIYKISTAFIMYSIIVPFFVTLHSNSSNTTVTLNKYIFYIFLAAIFRTTVGPYYCITMFTILILD